MNHFSESICFKPNFCILQTFFKFACNQENFLKKDRRKVFNKLQLLLDFQLDIMGPVPMYTSRYPHWRAQMHSYSVIYGCSFTSNGYGLIITL